MAMVKDVVCGMEIDSEKAAGKSEYEGTTYYFCGDACKSQFDANPAKYVAGAGAASEAPAEAAPMEPAAERPKKWWEFWR